MRFRDRIDAGEALARRLAQYADTRAVVMAIPRGAVPMAAVLARRLRVSLDVVLVRKIGAPFNPEYAVGAVDEGGWTYVAPYAAQAGADEAWLARATEREMDTMRERRRRYTPHRGPIDIAGRTVIVVDDGLATGATMVAALHSLHARNPAKLVCAVPVASAEAIALVREHADDVVCLDVPAGFRAVGEEYEDFRQVSDEEVIAALAATDATRPG
ncbi:MAG: phosphoribosyltransferase family protein [Burkholderiales bacterium]